MDKTPLDAKIAHRLGCAALTIDAVRAWQLERLRETLDIARHSRFYRRQLQGAPELRALSDLAALPFTTPAHIAAAPNDFLCVPPHEVARIVTLSTSGTTGAPKRVFFTQGDQALTTAFFSHGMRTMVSAGDRVIVFMPGTAPGSVGDLLRRGLADFGCDCVIYGPVIDYADALGALFRTGATCAVGIPAQMLSLARRSGPVRPGLHSVLLSADYISPALVRGIEDAWGCRVFGHYGMTETGLGGAVECAARAGAHMREDDLYFEIVDPETGRPVPDGTWGEVVFTTLTRRAMPLIRYRTGDRSRMLTAPCPCGSVLPRLDRVLGRISEEITLESGRTVTIAALDDLLFPLPGLAAYTAELVTEDGRDLLILTLDGPVPPGTAAGVLAPALGIRVRVAPGLPDFQTTGTKKRKLIDNRKG